MRGVIIDKGDRFELVVDIGRDPLTGARRRSSKTFRGSRRKAEEVLAKMVTEASAGQRPATTATVAQLLDEWLPQAELSPTTREEYGRLIEKRIKLGLGFITAQRLTAYDLDRFYTATTKAGLGPSSVRQMHAIIRRALGQAVRWEWLTKNVATLATPPKVRRAPVKPIALPAAIALLNAAEKEDPDLGIAVRLAAATGARRGELCALRWTDVDLDAALVAISRSLAEVKGARIEKMPKTYATRVITIDPGTVDALRRRLEHQQELAAKAMSTLDRDAFILSRQPGGSVPWLPSNLSGAWITFAKKQGAKMRFHDWRHLSVSVGLDAGIPVHLIAERHGHRDAHITLGIYGHSIAGRERLAADVIGKALGP